jgi:hypothetical protein
MRSDDGVPKRPVDILVDGDKFRALYADGTLSQRLTIDEMMDTLPLLQKEENPTDRKEMSHAEKKR